MVSISKLLLQSLVDLIISGTMSASGVFTFLFLWHVTFWIDFTLVKDWSVVCTELGFRTDGLGCTKCLKWLCCKIVFIWNPNGSWKLSSSVRSSCGDSMILSSLHSKYSQNGALVIAKYFNYDVLSESEWPRNPKKCFSWHQTLILFLWDTPWSLLVLLYHSSFSVISVFQVDSTVSGNDLQDVFQTRSHRLLAEVAWDASDHISFLCKR